MQISTSRERTRFWWRTPLRCAAWPLLAQENGLPAEPRRVAVAGAGLLLRRLGVVMLRLGRRQLRVRVRRWLAASAAAVDDHDRLPARGLLPPGGSIGDDRLGQDLGHGKVALDLGVGLPGRDLRQGHVAPRVDAGYLDLGFRHLPDGLGLAGTFSRCAGVHLLSAVRTEAHSGLLRSLMSYGQFARSGPYLATT